MPSILHLHPSVPADGSKPEGAVRDSAAGPRECAFAVLGCILAGNGVALIASYGMPLAGVAFTVTGAAVTMFGNRAWRWLGVRLTNSLIAPPEPRATGRRGRRQLGAAAVSAALMLAAPAPGVAAPQTDLTYGGLASPDLPVYLELDRGGRSIREVVATLDLKCTSGGGFTITDGYERVPLRATGKFHASFVDPPELVDGDKVSWSSAVRGRFDRRRSTAKGTWEAKLTTTDASTGQTDTCSAKTPFAVYR